MSIRLGNASTTRVVTGMLLAGGMVLGLVQSSGAPPARNNKETVQQYMDAFSALDHAAVLDCLTDDVEWFIPGAFLIRGKAAFDREIENDAFTGKPDIRVSRLTEEHDVVIAEGSVRGLRKDGSRFKLLFCDVFEMRAGKIKRLTSFLAEIKDETSDVTPP
jgi:ketosteroid isomerase-like protein